MFEIFYVLLGVIWALLCFIEFKDKDNSYNKNTKLGKLIVKAVICGIFWPITAFASILDWIMNY